MAFYHSEQFGWRVLLLDCGNTWMGSSSSHCPDTSRSPYSPMHQDATCTRGCCKAQNTHKFTDRHRIFRELLNRARLKMLTPQWERERDPKSNRDPKQSCSDLGDVVQQSFVESLYCVGMHLHTVGDQLDEVGNGIVPHVASCLWRGTSPFNVTATRPARGKTCTVMWQYLNSAVLNKQKKGCLEHVLLWELSWWCLCAIFSMEHT